MYRHASGATVALPLHFTARCEAMEDEHFSSSLARRSVLCENILSELAPLTRDTASIPANVSITGADGEFRYESIREEFREGN